MGTYVIVEAAINNVKSIYSAYLYTVHTGYPKHNTFNILKLTVYSLHHRSTLTCARSDIHIQQ